MADRDDDRNTPVSTDDKVEHLSVSMVSITQGIQETMDEDGAVASIVSADETIAFAYVFYDNILSLRLTMSLSSGVSLFLSPRTLTSGSLKLTTMMTKTTNLTMISVRMILRDYSSLRTAPRLLRLCSVLVLIC